ncbi:MAG: PIG-L family deacetylase, partial [Clostridiales bacterium]|nr:PIG-L family deacetylase [Clostridiales bacterium]
MSRLKLGKKILIITAAGIAFLIGSFFVWSSIHNTGIYIGLPQLENHWDENTRLLVFAPHCDDETIGSAFLIQEVLAARGTVKIVLFTNGEAFTYDSENTANNNLEAKDYISLGYKRQEETKAAMSLLGAKEEDIIFLGYPDGSLKRLWQNNWNEDNPYTSLTLGVPF